MIAYEKHGIDFRLLDIDDMPDFDITPLFQEATQLIHDYVSQGKSVLVVCTAGISRSAAIVIAYLIRFQRLPYAAALAQVKRARIFVQPNVGFERALLAYSDQWKPCDLCVFKKKTNWFE
jgi:protein-tyrosine phosphatase